MAAGIMDRLFRLMAEKSASDLFVSPGSAVHAKINGVAVPVGNQRLDVPTIRSMIGEVLTSAQLEKFDEHRELNFAHGVSGVGSFRLSLFFQRGSPAFVVRFIPNDIPQFESLGLPEQLLELVMEKRGLILMVGATGSGKTTTLAAMLEHRNSTKSGHILTFEDPIEFNFRSKRSIVNQREVGTDTETLAIGMKNALRQAPDVLLIGEIRDAQTMSAAMAYSQSGHLVLATLHANNSYHALNRVISFYQPEQRAALFSDLSTTLKSIISQRLVRTISGGRIPAVEILMNTAHIADLINDGHIGDIKQAMEQSLSPGSQTFDQALVALIRGNKVRKEDAMANADSPTNLLWLLENSTPADADSNAATPMPSVPGVPAGSPPPSAAPAAKPAVEGPSFSEFLLNV